MPIKCSKCKTETELSESQAAAAGWDFDHSAGGGLVGSFSRLKEVPRCPTHADALFANPRRVVWDLETIEREERSKRERDPFLGDYATRRGNRFVAVRQYTKPKTEPRR